MEPRDWPLEPLAAAVAVVCAVEDIHASGEDERDALLYELVRKAWGCIWAQDQ
jgi:hypothetical protein